uniref:TIL domain-containing protein n=1 Tax=Ascaris lumbricoides TaxID=6252 RepID=A0A9J2PR86_ASCLU
MIIVIFLLMVPHVKLYVATAIVNSHDSVTHSHSKSPCRQNERFAFCKSCEQTCPGVLQLACKPGCDSPGCYCDPLQGFVRDASGSCLPKAQCTGVVTQCRLNEVFTRCRTCEGRCGENGRLCLLICRESGCECPFRDGYVRDSSANCIPSGDCPAIPTATESESFMGSCTW